MATTLTIGIPAYNEAENIFGLLHSLLSQDYGDLILERIIVISDGSSDATTDQAKRIDDTRVRVISGRKQLGATVRQNQIFSLATSDIVVLFDADVLPVDDLVVQRLCQPIDSGIAELTSGRVQALAGTSYTSKVLSWHHGWKQSLYEAISLDNIYLCHGRIRAFGKELYQQLRWPAGAGEDAYSYIYCIESGMDFCFVPEAEVVFGVPQSVSDHIKQSVRFFRSRSISATNASSSSDVYYKIPSYTLARHLLVGIITHPVYALYYGFMLGLVVLQLLRKESAHKSHVWEVSESTKVAISTH